MVDMKSERMAITSASEKSSAKLIQVKTESDALKKESSSDTHAGSQHEWGKPPVRATTKATLVHASTRTAPQHLSS